MAIKGLWRPAPPGKEQSHELHAQQVTIIGAADSEVSMTITRVPAVFRESNYVIADVASQELSDPEKIPDSRIPPFDPTSQATSSLTRSARSNTIGVGVLTRAILSRPEFLASAVTSHHIFRL